MADYNVYYCEIKPISVPAAEGTSGQTTTVAPGSPAVEQQRQQVFTLFESLLASLFQRCVPNIPRGSRDWTVNVRRIPTSSPGVPNFAGLTINMREPIVYLVTSETDDDSSVQPTDRRPTLKMIRELGNFSSTFPGDFRSQARDTITTGAAEGGRAMTVTPYAPMVAEVFSLVRCEGADNWDEITAETLANLAFHEICHNKAECTNRATGGSRQWQPAISGIIHDVSGVEICGARVGRQAPSDADLRLMGQHMLCPLLYYQYLQPIAGQFFENGQSVTL